MSVANTIQKLATDIGNAYDEVQTKGGTIPQNKNTNNLATAIGSIPTGSTPTGQIAITQNGTYDVTNYASASVAVADKMELVNTFVLAESWENDTKGNPAAIRDSVLSGITRKTEDVYFIIAKNNNAQLTYRLNYICCSYGNYGFFARNDYNYGNTITSAFSTWVSAGSTIEVYKVSTRNLLS